MKALVNLFLFIITVHLAWDASVSPEVTGYKVYYGTSSGSYNVPIDVGNVTDYIIPNINENLPIFLAVKAYSADSESDYSAELSCAIIRQSISGHGTIVAKQSDWTSTKNDPIFAVEKLTGKSVIVTATPDTKYKVSAVQLDNVWVGPSNPYTISNVKADHTIYFVIKTKRTLEGLEWIK